MYLPQLTTGPSAAAWAPDSAAWCTPWQDRCGSRNSTRRHREQLTAGPGYDYQPDCSPDGRWVVYASYARDAVELWALNLDTRQYAATHSRRRCQCGATFSPDGKRIAFVSTSFNGHFHIFAGRFPRRRTDERPTPDRREPQRPASLLLQRSSIMKSARPGRPTGRKFFSFRIGDTSTALAVSGA